MIPIGKYCTLRVVSRDRYGLRLGDGREEVLLPNKFVPEGAEVGQSLRVFVYTDSEDTPIATTQVPHAQVGEFACLTVVDVTPHGAFLDWGLDKDLFVPNNQQHRPMAVGQKHVVAVYLDERTDRVAAAGRIAEFLDYDVSDLEVGAKVELLVYGFNRFGAQVIVDGRYGGLVYASETFVRLHVGSTLSGFIASVRDDNKLDISLQRRGAEALSDARTVIVEALERAGGFLPLHDGSSPEDIYAQLALSKKSFKAALGGLYRERRVELSDTGVRLVRREGVLRRS